MSIIYLLKNLSEIPTKNTLGVAARTKKQQAEKDVKSKGQPKPPPY